MQQIQLGDSELTSSRLAFGCMRIAGDGSAAARTSGKRAVRVAIEAGYTLFDHADIYANGECESLFGEVLRESPGLRDELVILGKCGIRFAGSPDSTSPGRYDFSSEHLLTSVDGSLKRLRVDTIDLLLLHRPDFLMRADDVAATFETLLRSGKVRYFGVSNFSVSQFALLQSMLSEPLLVHQFEINLHNLDTLDNGTLDQCQQFGVTPQAWSPLAGIAYPARDNRFSAEDEARIRAEIGRQAGIYDADATQLALAWLLCHPSGILPIIGSTTPGRIEAAVSALAIDYSREDWYRLLEARNGSPVP